MEWPSQSARVQNAILGCSLKHQRMISVHFQGKPFNITVIQMCATAMDAKEAEADHFYKDLQHFLELKPKKKKRYPFHQKDWNAKVGSQEIPGITAKFGLGVQNEAGQRLSEFCQENMLVIANTFFQQSKRWFYKNGHHQVVNTETRLIIFFAAKDEEALYSQ